MGDVTVCLGFDFDAVSVWIHGYGAENSPTKLSRGEYGATVAVPRILDLLDKLDVEATFFTPGHTIDSFPERAGDVHDRGHDVQHHGWSHNHPGSFDSKAAERADIERGIESIRDLTGEKPSGYRSPAWDFSTNTLEILREFDFDWDSSQMGHDFRPYYVREGGSSAPDEPYERGEPTDIVEIPVSWKRDDWPPFQYVSGADSQGGAPDEKQVFDMWKEQFDWTYEHVENGVFPLTFHPQVVGQAPRLRYLESLIRWIQEKPGVEFATIDSVARRFSAGSF
ncbi:polysaccharide deacetylase [Halorubrum sp. 48-1-W]|uniref:polysaccharide deacetylase family protein n=1 Tax=Halorubrum sp. 48-1-W TaxID=2249761 RepID=UPI000DCB463C|nr:polysaccharide deacetylase [Halorubrum sp. 48-1-W]RAW45006.1 polysaccharide deacetylase [Halorubrum sp. 48-1-W]